MLLQAWAVMEARQGDAALVRDLFRAGLAESPRSPFLHLAFGQWERQQGSLETARFLLRRGCQLNPSDPALAVVSPGSCARDRSLRAPVSIMCQEGSLAAACRLSGAPLQDMASVCMGAGHCCQQHLADARQVAMATRVLPHCGVEHFAGRYTLPWGRLSLMLLYLMQHPEVQPQGQHIGAQAMLCAGVGLFGGREQAGGRRSTLVPAVY